MPLSESAVSPHPAMPSARGWLQQWRTFFEFHGVWAPGVRLFRQWSIRRKIAVLLALLAVPAAGMTLYLLHTQRAEVAEMERRLVGVRVAGAVHALAADLDAQSRALLAGRPAVVDAQAGLYRQVQAEVTAARAARLPLDAAWEANALAVERVVGADGLSADTRSEALRDAVRGLLHVHAEAVQASGALLTADARLSSRSRLAFELLPALEAESSRIVRALGRYQALMAGGTPSAAQVHELVVEVAGLTEGMSRSLRQAERHLHLLARVDPVDGLRLPDELAETRRFIQEVKRSVLAYPPPAREPGADAAPGAALAASSLAEVSGLAQRLADAVASQLDAQRQAGIVAGRLLMAGLLVTGLLGMYVVYSFFLVMRGGLAQLNRQITRMSRGDLSARPQPLGADEVALALVAMSQSLARLSDLLSSVREGVAAVSQASQQVALGNADLSARNRVAGVNLEQLVAGVASYGEQLLASGRQVERVVGTVQALRLEAARNRRQMERLRERLQSLQGKSREIGQIVTLIDAIAFRTNILALNASVEASKAGEAGRGFAVVAQEVRSLAKRSADSARRIGDIAARSSEDIHLSGALAEETGRSMTEADAHVDKIHAAMSDVAALTRSGEQASGDILARITELKESTEKNQRLVEQLAGASDAMRSQGERLALKVGAFTLS